MKTERNCGYGGMGAGAIGDIFLRYKLATHRQISPRDLMHSLVITVNKTVL